MPGHSLTHLSDGSLRRELISLVATDCRTTAQMLAHLAEFDARRLYAEEGCSSMFTYCVEKLRFSEDTAFKRIRVARATRRFPALLDAIAGGRLHLTGAVFLAPCLEAENSEELIQAATHKTKSEIELLLAQRFPRPDVPSLIRALPAPGPKSAFETQVVPEPVAGARSNSEIAQALIAQVVPEPGALAAPRVLPPSRVMPLAPQRFSFQTTISQDTKDKLQQIRELLGHQVEAKDLEQILGLAFDALLEKLQRSKFAATSQPSDSRRPSGDPRHVPAAVKRQVWERDGGRCTFISSSGCRCSERRSLEYDHVQEVARGGGGSMHNIRLRCRTHNQYTAEKTFGLEFMRAKREAVSPCRGASPRRSSSAARR